MKIKEVLNAIDRLVELQLASPENKCLGLQLTGISQRQYDIAIKYYEQKYIERSLTK